MKNLKLSILEGRPPEVLDKEQELTGEVKTPLIRGWWMDPAKNEFRDALTKKFVKKWVAALNEGPHPLIQDCEFRPVQSWGEFKAVSGLVYDTHMKKYNTPPVPGQYSLAFFNLLQRATPFVVVLRKELVLGTVTLIHDSPVGVPMDNVYGRELQNLRDNGRRVSEVCMMAFDDRIFNHPSVSNTIRFQIISYLLRAVIEHVQTETEVNTLVMSVDPRHRVAYEAMSCETVGPLRFRTPTNRVLVLGYALDLRPSNKDFSQTLRLHLGIGAPRFRARTPKTQFHLNMESFRELWV